MIDDNDEKKTERLYDMWVCPNCGRTVHISRSYCDCHADITSAMVKQSKTPPEIGPCNFETSRLCCNDCPETCKWCPSFASPEPNKKGFGGKDCRHSGSSARCYCCQAQVKIGISLGKAGISKTMGNMTSKSLHIMAGIIQEKVEEMVLARINREREKAG
jgi:hypothetical protein